MSPLTPWAMSLGCDSVRLCTFDAYSHVHMCPHTHVTHTHVPTHSLHTSTLAHTKGTPGDTRAPGERAHYEPALMRQVHAQKQRTYFCTHHIFLLYYRHLLLHALAYGVITLEVAALALHLFTHTNIGTLTSSLMLCRELSNAYPLSEPNHKTQCRTRDFAGIHTHLKPPNILLPPVWQVYSFAHKNLYPRSFVCLPLTFPNSPMLAKTALGHSFVQPSHDSVCTCKDIEFKHPDGRR